MRVSTGDTLYIPHNMNVVSNAAGRVLLLIGLTSDIPTIQQKGRISAL